MKIIGLFLFLSTISTFLQAQEETIFRNLGTGVTNIVASTTNQTAGEIFHNYKENVPFRIWVKAEGNAATTNGVSTASNLVVRIVTASGSQFVTNSFDTPMLTNIKLTVPSLGASTNVVSDYFELRGARYFRIGAIENNYLGSVSNLQIIVGTPK